MYAPLLSQDRHIFKRLIPMLQQLDIHKHTHWMVFCSNFNISLDERFHNYITSITSQLHISTLHFKCNNQISFEWDWSFSSCAIFKTFLVLLFIKQSSHTVTPKLLYTYFHLSTLVCTVRLEKMGCKEKNLRGTPYPSNDDSCGKVIFSLVSVCSQGGGGWVCLVPCPSGSVGMPAPMSLLWEYTSAPCRRYTPGADI